MKPEILAPAGNWAMLNAAINAGADAVYFGIKGYNMRHSASNFTIEDLKEIGKLKIKKYLALNTIIFDNEIDKVKKILDTAKSCTIDAVICWDLAVVELAKNLGLDVHLSTQASVSNSISAEFYKKLGIKRIILARELNLKQIQDIKEKVNIEVEVFVHGAMCVSLSGRCFMSHFLMHKSANRGKCFQPCRRPYIIKDKELNYELEVGNNYILSPKDLCAMPIIDKILSSNIDSIKIEGRSKSPEYVDIVVRCYRKAVDAYYDNKLSEQLKNELLAELKTAYNRTFSTGFLESFPLNEWATSEGNESKVKKEEIGIVLNYYKKSQVALIKVTANSFKLNDTLLFTGNKTGVVRQVVNSIMLNDKNVDIAQKGDIVTVKVLNLVRENDKVFNLRQGL
ncbi:U32 family peptidase [Candidatus Woesearchaeota archaeon]|nr:MAG: U32 family peptidase [Candidatus Woesearchaeota archaeon]